MDGFLVLTVWVGCRGEDRAIGGVTLLLTENSATEIRFGARDRGSKPTTVWSGASAKFQCSGGKTKHSTSMRCANSISALQYHALAPWTTPPNYDQVDWNPKCSRFNSM